MALVYRILGLVGRQLFYPLELEGRWLLWYQRLVLLVGAAFANFFVLVFAYNTLRQVSLTNLLEYPFMGLYSLTGLRFLRSDALDILTLATLNLVWGGLSLWLFLLVFRQVALPDDSMTTRVFLAVGALGIVFWARCLVFLTALLLPWLHEPYNARRDIWNIESALQVVVFALIVIGLLGTLMCSGRRRVVALLFGGSLVGYVCVELIDALIWLAQRSRP